MKKTLNLNSSLSGERCQPALLVGNLPLPNRLISKTKAASKRGRATGLFDRCCDCVGTHDAWSITESNHLATTESYSASAHTFSMDTKLAFAKRLTLALDEAGFPSAISGRQTALAKATGKSQPGVRKWLLGEALPNMTSGIELAKLLNVRFEWLMTGRGMMKLETEVAPLTDEQKRFVYRLRCLPPDEQARYFRVAEAMGMPDLPSEDAA